MGKILRCAIILLIVDSFMVNFSVCTEETNTVEKSFEANQIVPDVVLKAPTGLLKVVYPGDVEVKLGNELTPTQVKDTPTVTWEASPANLYTIVMTDPDAPSRQDPKSREFCHWMVGNVPGDNVAYGETLFYYVGSGPPEKTGLHRYVFLVYKQVGPITFDEPRVINTSRTNRPKFSIAKFAKKYNLGEPIAGNFFQAQYDDYVPTVHQQLNG